MDTTRALDVSTTGPCTDYINDGVICRLWKGSARNASRMIIVVSISLGSTSIFTQPGGRTATVHRISPTALEKATFSPIRICMVRGPVCRLITEASEATPAPAYLRYAIRTEKAVRREPVLRPCLIVLTSTPHQSFRCATFSHTKTTQLACYPPVILHIHYESPETTITCPRLRGHFSNSTCLQHFTFPPFLRNSNHHIPPPFNPMWSDNRHPRPLILRGANRLGTKSSSHATVLVCSGFFESAESDDDVRKPATSLL